MTPGQRAACYGLLTALALCAGYLEMLVPLPVGIPGVKLGLGNAVVLFALFFYGPVKGLYQAWRTEGVRQEQLAELSSSNEAYQQEIDRLQTREGIEDEARRRGYVAEGETSIVVEGGEEDDGSTEESTGDETPWYLHVADFIFRYDGSDGGAQ